MLGSLRGLLVLGGFATLLLVVAIFDREPAPVDRAILPGFDATKLAELDWKLGDREIQLHRSGDRWRWVEPPGLADPDAIDRLITALRGGRWQRRAGVAAAGALRGELALSGATTIGIGQPLAGTEQAWLVVNGEALLVDGWIANALAPDPLALRVRHPLDGALDKPLKLGDMTLAGTTLAFADHTVRITPALRAQLAAALEGIEIVALPPVPPPPLPSAPLELATPTVTVREAGACGAARILLATTAGAGCVAAERWSEVVAAVAALRAPAEAIVDRRPAAGAKRVVLVDGTPIDLVKIGASFDAGAVGELAAALATPAEIATTPAKPTGKLEVDGAALTLYDDGSVARATEPLRLLPDPAARAILRRTGEAFRDPRLWAEEPTTIAAIEIDGKTFARGASLGEWRSGDAKTLDALALALASPTSLGTAPPFAERAHVVALQIRRPDGGETRHELALARDCRGSADGRTVKLPAALCALVDRLR